MNGLILLDKPPGISSQQAVTQIKRLFNVKKAGHTGTLDPFATGLLPVCLNEATKYADYFLQANKRYRAIAKLGVCSTTGDSEGTLVECLTSGLPTLPQIQAKLLGLIGKQYQYPSRYAAIKYQGKKLYEYARQGIQVPLQPRQIEILQLQLVRYEPAELELDIVCSKGTYIRSLVSTLGAQLECGAYTQALRRLAVGTLERFPVWNMTQLQILKDTEGEAGLHKAVVNIDAALIDFPQVILEPRALLAIQQGKVEILAQPIPVGLVKIYDHLQQFWGLGVYDGQCLRAKRLFAINRLV